MGKSNNFLHWCECPCKIVPYVTNKLINILVTDYQKMKNYHFLIGPIQNKTYWLLRLSFGILLKEPAWKSSCYVQDNYVRDTLEGDLIERKSFRSPKLKKLQAYIRIEFTIPFPLFWLTKNRVSRKKVSVREIWQFYRYWPHIHFCRNLVFEWNFLCSKLTSLK